MDLLDQICFEPLELKVTTGRIYAGWMDFTIKTPSKCVFYKVSYICNPVRDIVQAAVLLIRNKPLMVSFTDTSNCCVIEHHCETEGIYYWIILREFNTVRVMCYHNCSEFVETMVDMNFSSSKTYDIYNDLPDIHQNLMFAVKGTTHDFVFFVKDLLWSLASKPGLAKKKLWPYDIPEEHLMLINSFQKI